MASIPIRTLLVDDVEALRRLARMVLEDSDRYEVVGEAADGDQALDAVEETAPDLVLLDLSMPGRDGFEVLQEIRKRAPDSRVVVLSVHEGDTVREKALDAGAIGYLEKGLTPEDLVAGLDAIVEASDGA